ncbi:MAG: hypothetical protein ACFFBP_06705 [Promethearchaeota archaeon]
MITTREAINYQFSLIFGYSSSKEDDLVVGDVIGPGNLMKEKVKELSHEVIKFLRMYNAILRDYTGSELYSIEFSLFNKEELQKEGVTSIRIYPKSMILLPGKYKDCESSLLALKPEPDVLNPHKSREAMNDISELFYEVEEFSERPEINSKTKELLLQKFSTRFSNKLFGDLLEHKWNKEMVGLSLSLPTGKEMIDVYAKVKSEMQMSWYKRPHELDFINPQYESHERIYEGKNAIEHLKYAITEPSSNFIVGYTLKLGTDLFELCNTGTIDEIQDEFISFLINSINDEFKKINDNYDINQLINKFKQLLSKINQFTNRFLDHSNSFIISGKKGDLKELLEMYKIHVIEKGKVGNDNYDLLLDLTINLINQSISEKDGLRASELGSLFNSLRELFKNSYDIIITSLPRYLLYRIIKNFTNYFMMVLSEDLKKEEDQLRILGSNFIGKLKDFILNQIEMYPITVSGDLKINQTEVIKDFKNFLRLNFDSFFKTVKIKVGDIFLLAEETTQLNSEAIKKKIELFKKLPGELNYFINYIMKYTTINRFLKENPISEISDPVTFSNKFFRFLEKRIGGVNLNWKSYLLSWINDYAKQYFKELDKKPMTLDEIYNDFLKYFTLREIEEQNPENFVKIVHSLNEKLSVEQENSEIFEFLKQYENYIDVINSFPNHFKEIINDKIQTLNLSNEETHPNNFLKIDNDLTFYQFIKEKELKYFSNLIPRPSSLILKHTLSDEEKLLFRKPLYHVINFTYWHGHSSFYLADNFKTTFREWEKQL